MSIAIHTAMEKIIDIPILFLGITVLIFAAIVAVLAIISYAIACTRSKNTEMSGIMRVGVTLNQWYDDSKCTDSTELQYGMFWISMKDPVTITEARLNPALTWLEQAFCRKYDVSIMLRRFVTAYKGAGMANDPSAKLLDSLLAQEKFCKALGKCSFKNEKRGLVVSDAYACRKEANKNKVSVFYAIDGGAYGANTGCDAQTICVTLEYQK